MANPDLVGLSDEQKEATMYTPPAPGPSGEEGKQIFNELLALLPNRREPKALQDAINKRSKDELEKARGYAATLTTGDERSAEVVGRIMDKLGLTPKYAGRKSRLNVKRRRTQRHRGGRKHRKLRKLTTRRR